VIQPDLARELAGMNTRTKLIALLVTGAGFAATASGALPIAGIVWGG
jgi:hypothetical protein